MSKLTSVSFPVFFIPFGEEKITDYDFTKLREDERWAPSTSQADRHNIGAPFYSNQIFRILEDYPKLERKIMMKFYKYMNELGISDQFQLTTSWLTNVGKGDSITGHSHKNCEFSGILYFDKQENYENQPPLTFENPLRRMTMYQTSNMAVINGYQSDWSRSPEEGLILFWPAYISHSCETKTERWSDKNRRSLAFNFTPTGFYGTADSTMDIRWLSS